MPGLTIFRTSYTSLATLGIPSDPYIGNIDLVTGRAGRGLRGADWVSPLFWPESNTTFLRKFRSSCNKILWQLVQGAHDLIELVIGASANEGTVDVDSATSTLGALRSLIEGFPKGEERDNALVTPRQVHRYESCRLTAVLMTRMISGGTTWSDAASDTSFEEEIVFSLSNSDLEDFWGEHVGLLYWVSLIAYAVLHKTRHRLFGAGLVHRLISEITFGDQDPHIGIQSLKRLSNFEEGCRIGK